jgi:sec-independent protein translocase protein TatA
MHPFSPSLPLRSAPKNNTFDPMSTNVLLFNFLGPEMIVIVLVILLLFGGKKIPELMRGLGSGIKEFKDASRGDDTKMVEKKD